ncbi:microsomal triacylglycerol transfer protein [Sabethes cyaneus]|uniref:microsomal triacylglycerol transfer protein n=1 Tax=Sabethes cyaneus TaxID=53552 RepID=UPI00237DCD19|nr:microsomal triacylglycerol transfer protein [Sabethes cyaneus]
MKLQLMTLMLAAFFGRCHPAPAFGDAFQLGTEQSYSYWNEVRTGSTRNASSTVGYIVRATVHVATIWGNDDYKLLRFKVTNPTLSTIPGEVVRKSTLSDISSAPFFAHWHLGQIEKIYVDKDDDVTLINFKRGLASLFQYQLLDGKYVEVDPSGTCDVLYTSHDETRYQKARSNCLFSGDRSERSEYPLRSSTTYSRNTDFTVNTDGSLDRVIAEDYFKYFVNAYDNFGSFLDSVVKVYSEGSTTKVNTVQGNTVEEAVENFGLVEKSLLSEKYAPKCSGKNCDTFSKLVRTHKKSLTDDRIGKQETSSLFLQLVKLGRVTPTEPFQRLLKGDTMQEQRGQILDLLGAIQTVAAHEAAKSVLTFESDDEMVFAERYLQALAAGSQPQKTIIEDLLVLAEKKRNPQKFYDTLVQTVASLANRYAKLPGNSFDTDVVEKVKDYLLKELNWCAKDKCKLQFIRGLHNLKSPKTLNALVELALEGSAQVSVAAMKALRSFSIFLWNDEFRAMFEDILFQVSKKFDTSARALALDILLDLKPDFDELTHLAQLLKSNDKVYELKQYLLQKLRMLADRCPHFAEMLRKVIQNDPSLNNYHVIGARGLSTALMRTYSSGPSFNASLESLQEMSGGVLKRGIVDLTLEVGEEKFSMFTLGLFASGMSSFVSNNEDEILEDDSDTVAGMELTVQGSVFRPLVFFDGKTDLMRHVWSGTASEPTPAYQATTLLQDNEEWYALQNGAVFKLSTLGAISIDLNGQVTLSLWSRNAQSKVEQNTAIVVSGNVKLDTSYVSLDVSFVAGQEPQLHLTSDLDFATDPALCMQLLQPNSILSQTFERTVTVPMAKYRKIRQTKVTHKIAGQTHMLNQKNNAMCNLIAKS